MDEMLAETARRNASDLHLTINSPPLLRIGGELVAMGQANLTAADTDRLCREILTPRHLEVLSQKHSADLAISVGDAGRFRVAAYYQKGSVSVAVRRLSDEILPLESLGLPDVLGELSQLRDGLVLVTGATGSGKSTTLATIIDMINSTSRRNIITIEDPIEYVHLNKQSIVNQRELYTDVTSFPDALREALRADPDVILVGEMRDLDTTRTAIMAAETGHLVFSTLHSRDAVSSINRMIGLFGPAEQMQIRQQLSSALKAVVSQQLLPCRENSDRIPAVEVMMVTSAIGNLIRLGKNEQIYAAIETGVKQGMGTMEQSLIRLLKAGRIDKETAIHGAQNPATLRQRLAHK
ncbi:MAG: PilT/PilU family type 4a pilus ATPase [Phycisphaerae bacterium]|nr:PilT/PilU family type 4a pilus ATPase [Phycisphaerae bacterium]